MKIYWNEKKQQIMTKDGVCRYDKGAANTLQSQLQCSAKGHGKWAYKETKIVDTNRMFTATGKWGYNVFVFKCSACGLEITKTKGELKPAEKEALKKLNLL